MPASVVDLFCGAGGLTHGFLLEDVNVVAGVDSDPACEFPYEHNNARAKFFRMDVSKLSGAEVRAFYPEGDTMVLAGCAPCQPFSTNNRGKESSEDKPREPSVDGEWRLLYSFARLIAELRPEVVTMENVARLRRLSVYKDFVGALNELGYQVTAQVVRCEDYGVPQTRHRLVLLGSLLGPIRLCPPTRDPGSYVTVREMIGGLEALAAGESSAVDRLHVAAKLSPTNLLRIRSSKPLGTWRDWREDLVADCHRRDTGRTYPGVYGRMSWDRPGPTITTECFAFGSGRFGHPEQDRAITLREAALLQTFPKDYEFVKAGDPIYMKRVGRLVGNAVPVALARAIGRSIKAHLKEFGTGSAEKRVEVQTRGARVPNGEGL